MGPNTKAVSGNSTKKKQTGKSKKRKLSFWKILLVTILVVSCAAVGILSGLTIGYIRNSEPVSAEQLQLSKFTSFIYDMNGTEITPLQGEENRIWVDDKDIPQHVKDAFLALEDERFFKHKGVDLLGLVSAVFGKVTNPDAPMRGASTITQQVIKVFTGNDERKIERKIQEQWNAILLEQKMEKWQILEFYLNLVTTGPNIYGVQTASKYYFNKDVKDITIAEAASIAGITNNPSIYSPISEKGIENNKNRQKDCLNNMLELEMISQAEYDKAINEELTFIKSTSIKPTSKQSYFVDQAINDVKDDLMEKYNYSEQQAYRVIYNTGVKIYTTMDPNVQKSMNEVFNNDAYFPAGNRDKASDAAAQAAMVVIDPVTGQVRGIYGGYGEKKGDLVFNYATPGKRQPGSTIKPIAVYGPAMDLKQITAGTVIDDVPVYLDPQNPGKVYPYNYDHTFGGLTAIRDGIRNSVNVVAARVYNGLGPDQSIKYLKRMGIDLDIKKDGSLAPLALGALTEGISALELAAAFVPFTNNGVYYEPATYTKVLDNEGNVLLEKKQSSSVVYDDERTPYIMTDMMKGVVNNGTAYPSGIIKNAQGQVIPTAGKTGTTSDNKDKWFVGYSTKYVGATWYGYMNPTVISSGERSNALKIWNAVMTKIHAEAPPEDFKRPAGIVEKTFCIISGKVPSELCALDPRGQETIRYNELFIKGTEPANGDECDVHVSAMVDTSSKDGFGRPLLATPFCPRDLVTQRIFVKRREPFSPQSADASYPKDWIYELPRQQCDIHSALSVITGKGEGEEDIDDEDNADGRNGQGKKDSKNGNNSNGNGAKKDDNPLKDLLDIIQGN